MQDNKKLICRFFVIALFLFGLYYYCFRVLGFDLSRTPGDYGDSRFINYVLEHGFKWLKGEDPNFWQANFMYPLENNIAISDSMAGALPLYALFRFTGFDVETAYQLWWLITCVLNFWCCFWAFKKLDFNPCLSAIGAYVFAFGINNLNQFYHLQFNYKFLIPVALAALYLFLNKGRLSHFIWMMAAVVLQFYASAYLGVILIYFLVVFGIVYLISKKSRQHFFASLTKKTVLWSSISVIASLMLMMVLALPYHQMASSMGYRDYERELLPALPRIYSYFFASGSSDTWDILKDSPLKQGPAWYLHDMFPGIFCYAGLVFFIAYAIRKRIRKQAVPPLPLALLFTSLLFIALTTKTESDFSLFKYFREMPGLASMRLTSRFMIPTVFLLLWLNLFFLRELNFRKPVLVFSLLAVMVICDNLFTPDPVFLSVSEKRIREDRVMLMRARIKALNTEHKKIIACLNLKQDAEPFMQLDVMMACQQMDLYTLNGYSSSCAGELCFAYDDPKHEKLSQWLKRFHIPEEDVLFISN